MRTGRPSFLDTNVLVYEWDERDPKKQAIAKELVSRTGRNGVVSSQVLHEFTVVMRTRLHASSAQIRLILGSYRGFGFFAVDHETIEEALRVADDHQISYWDALIVQAAVRTGCKTLYTEDLNSGQVIEGVKVVNPFIP